MLSVLTEFKKEEKKSALLGALFLSGSADNAFRAEQRQKLCFLSAFLYCADGF